MLPAWGGRPAGQEVDPDGDLGRRGELGEAGEVRGAGNHDGGADPDGKRTGTAR